MSVLLKIVVFLLLSFQWVSAQASKDEYAAGAVTRVAQLNQIVAGFPSGAVSSVIVRNAGTGELLYAKGSDQNLVPASVQKVLTAIAAYETLGSDFRYSTRLLSGKPVNKSEKIEGGAQLLFSGDPSFTRENLQGMLDALTRQGVKKINGTLWLDGSAYDGYSSAEGVVWNDLKICFAAPATAMILDRNCFYALLQPAEKVGRKAVVEYARPDWSFRLENNVITSAVDDKGCQPKSWESEYADYRLTGCVAKDSSPLRMAFAVKRPEEAIKAFVESSLRRQGIIHHGSVVIGKPDNAFDHKLAEHESAPLPELLSFMLDTSDNIYADSILKTLGQQAMEKSGSYESGTKALRDSLKRLGVDLGSSHFEDGSGLSRYNLLSAFTLSSALLLSWDKWGEDMPWLKGRPQEYWFKTGTMKDTRALAGYVFPKNKSPKIFVILLNGLVPDDESSVEEAKSFWSNIRTQQQAFLNELLNK